MRPSTYSVRLRRITLCAIFTALIAIGAFIRIPVPILSISLQTLFTTLAGLLLGGRLGCLSVLCYMLVGLMGVPVFTEGGGLGYILRPSFGYIIGFCIGAFITGKIAQKACKPSYGRLLLAGFSGMAAIYLCGLLYYYVICNYVINTPIAVWPLFLHCFIMVVPGDVALCFLSAYLALRLKRHVEKIIGLDTMNRN